MGCLISFPTLPTKKQSACFPLPGVDACSRLENSEVEGNSFFSLAGNPVNWKITDFRFSESLSWTPTNKSPLQANLTGKMLCCLLYGPWQGEQWKEKQEPGLPPNNPLLWWESSFFFHLPFFFFLSLPSFFLFFLLPIFPSVKNPRKLFLHWKVEDLPKLSITFYDALGALVSHIAVLWCLAKIVGAGITKNCLLHLFIS